MGVFLALILSGVVVMFLLVNIATVTQFRRFVLSGDVIQASELAVLLSDYYTQQGSWAGVGTLLETGLATSAADWPMGRMMGPGMMGWSMEKMSRIMRDAGPLVDRVAVANAFGIIVADSAGLLVGQEHADHLESGVPIVIDGQRVGTVLVGSMIEPVLNPLDQDFLRSVNLSVLLSALAVGAVALVLGSFLFRQITAPLSALSAAAEAIAAGDLSRTVGVSSNDEIGRLGRSFNAMARSLARAEALRRNMVTDIAHELRTPLTIIQGNLEALLDGVLDLTPKNVASIHEETMLLSRLVTDLRDLALAEVGQLKLDREQADLTALAARIVDSFRTQAVERGIALTTELALDLPWIDIDVQRISQVLFNLLSNALRHTLTGGTITVRAERVGDHAQVTVADTGEGIPSEDLPYVFERFYRADKSRARVSRGSGLGLTIAKQIIEAHGGRICVRSWVGVGSTFIFTLPVRGGLLHAAVDAGQGSIAGSAAGEGHRSGHGNSSS
jgi:two-component system OmpR family sensor kinase/two-component system sensor histidine kinase BaeS